MIWNEVLKECEQGNYFTYPSNIKGTFKTPVFPFFDNIY